MRNFSLSVCLIVILVTGLPLINLGTWWIRVFDFPRVQIAILTLFALILAYRHLDFPKKYNWSILFILAVALVYHLQFVLVYTPLFPTNAKDSNQFSEDQSFSLLVVNVLMENKEREPFHELVKDYNPDLLLINEPDEKWAASISKLDDQYPFSIKQPQENTYGMILLSKLPLSESSVNYLVKDDVPSIFTQVSLPSGQKFDFYGVHPEPPKPGTDTYERDTELLIVGKEIRESQNPTVVAGDLNDVGWSITSRLFRKYSRLVDPREGRGLFNTYNVFLPLFRYPLDHIFYSDEFGLVKLEKLESIGSDHFPMFIELSFEPDGDNTNGQENTDSEENEEVEEKIEEGKKENEKDKN